MEPSERSEQQRAGRHGVAESLLRALVLVGSGFVLVLGLIAVVNPSLFDVRGAVLGGGFGFLLLAITGFYVLYQRSQIARLGQGHVAAVPGSSVPGDASQDMRVIHLSATVTALERRVVAAERRAQGVDAMNGRLTTVESQLPRAAAVETLARRLHAIESQQVRPGSLEGLERRLAATESLQPRVHRLEALESRVANVEAREPRTASFEAIERRLGMLEARESRSGKTDELDRRLSALEEASTSVAVEGLDRRLRILESWERRLATLEASRPDPSALDVVQRRLGVVESLERRVAGLDALDRRVAGVESLNRRVAELEGLNGRLDDLDAVKHRFASIETLERRLHVLESLEIRLTRLETLESRVSGLEPRVTGMEPRLSVLDSVERRLSALETARRATPPPVIAPAPAAPIQPRTPLLDPAARWTPFGDVHPVIDVEGIGPAWAARLKVHGINTTKDLWLADAAALSTKVGIGAPLIRQWQQMAELMAVTGLGKQYSELLVKAGFTTIAELAKVTVRDVLEGVEKASEDLTHRIQKNPVTPKLVEGWIEAARNHRPTSESPR